MSNDDLSQFSMLELFRVEAEGQTAVLTSSLLALEREPAAATLLEACMRAAHSLKGAARIINLPAAVRVAHAMEDCFVAAQKGELRLTRGHIDVLLEGVDLLGRLSRLPENAPSPDAEIDTFLQRLAMPPAASTTEPTAAATPSSEASTTSVVPSGDTSPSEAITGEPEAADRVLRVTAEHLNRLLGLAGESLVESRRLKPYGESLLRLKRQQRELVKRIDVLRESLSGQLLPETTAMLLAEIQERALAGQQQISARLVELDQFDNRSAHLANRLYTEALACRMRPFRDGVHGFPRMVRDVARSLGKQVRFEVIGESTAVDRDILEKLEAPLGHLLRNALDHGLETAAERTAAGKSAESVIRLEARHAAGGLLIIVSDDGRGVDLERVRAVVVRRQLTSAEIASRLSQAELLEFLFLPGFSLKENVTEISGRGVGLDVVQTIVKEVRGTVRIQTQPGHGTSFHLQLPLTLSVARTLLVEIGGEPYAFPLAYIVRTLRLPRERIELLEGRQHFLFSERQIGLVPAHQVLGRPDTAAEGEEVPVVVIGQAPNWYGLAVDRFLGERELVVQPLDSRLGKVKDISAGALMEDGAPVLIVDVDDLLRSVEKLAGGGQLQKVQRKDGGGAQNRRKRVLVVDDSLTVRELERKLLESRGYEVEVAVDGMDGWNAVRTGHFALVVSDIDMPRMDGIELVTLIKRDMNLKALPVMIVSYKDREEDRRRGLEAGADYYLTKGSFHDETLLQAVRDLIGDAIA